VLEAPVIKEINLEIETINAMHNWLDIATEARSQKKPILI
jgi:hypothetical protein